MQSDNDERAQSDRRRRRRSEVSALLWGAAGLLLGSALGRGPWSALSGLALGLLWSSRIQARKRIDELEALLRQVSDRVLRMESGDARATAPAPERATAAERDVAPAAAPTASDRVAPEPTAPDRVAARVQTPVSATTGTPDAPTPSLASTSASAPPTAGAHADSVAGTYEPPPTPFDNAFRFVRGLLFGGNTVVRVAVLVLLVGVTVLVQWAVENDLFPIEARLASASAIGLALTGVGFWLRDRQPSFGTTLQGGGIAALYLVVFFAYRVYALIPAEMAFGLFTVIALACGILSVAQSSQPLIVIGSLGGFLAPVLSSSGSGNHVVLFSYYLVLNLAIAAVAWHKTWRGLNVLAFVATYGIATVWGVLRYRPQDFASTEPFLLAYMVLFTGIAVVFSMRQPPRLAGLVDGTLVFGTPLVTLLAQSRLVEGMEFGMAYSTAGFGLFYAALATWVWRRSPDTLRRLSEAFIALAVGFGTMAIPLALDDGLSTTFVWSLEGAGLYWVGARQGRRLPRYTGIFLQVLAAFAYGFATEMGGYSTRTADFMLIANPRFLAGVGLALSGFFIAREAWALRARIPEMESKLGQVLAGWGLLWWAGGALAEIDQFVTRDYQVTGALLLLAGTGLALERIAKAVDWMPGRVLAGAALPAAFLMLPAAIDVQPHLFAHGGFLAWPLALAAVYRVLVWIEACEVDWTPHAYGPALWLVALVVALGLGGMAENGLDLDGDWPLAAFGIGLGSVLLAAHFAQERGLGPVGRYPRIHLELGAGPIVALVLGFSVVLNGVAQGDAAPLPYLPLLNATDITLAWMTIAVLTCWNRLVQTRPTVGLSEWTRFVGPVLGGLAFIWLNGILVRSVHQWTGVAFDADALWDSTALQVSLSLAWALVALAGMLMASARGHRPVWLTFATLLGVVVVKLFIVDLTQLSTPAKIGTFLCVGVLLLVIGYLSPVPPSRDDDAPDASMAAVEGTKTS